MTGRDYDFWLLDLDGTVVDVRQSYVHEVVEAVETVARDAGADVHTGVEVTGLEPIEGGVAAELGGDRYVHDRVVCNAPPAHVERELLPDGTVSRLGDYWDRRTYGPSAHLLYLGVEGELPGLEHHTLALPTDWDPHFAAIFDDPAWPTGEIEPVVYVNVPSRTDPSVAPDGHEAVVTLVPLAPGLEDTPDRREALRERVLDAVASRTGVDLRDRRERARARAHDATDRAAPSRTARPGNRSPLLRWGEQQPGDRRADVPARRRALRGRRRGGRRRRAVRPAAAGRSVRPAGVRHSSTLVRQSEKVFKKSPSISKSVRKPYQSG